MAIETFEFIDDLVAANPTATDNVSEGDDHLRGLKTTLKNTFPNVDAAVTPTATELNYVDGVTSSIQTQLGTLTTGLGNVNTDLVNDTTPQLGGDLDLNGHAITGLASNALKTDFTVASGKTVTAGTVANFSGGKIGNNPVVNTQTALNTSATYSYDVSNDTGTVVLRAEQASSWHNVRVGVVQANGSITWNSVSNIWNGYSSASTTVKHIRGNDFAIQGGHGQPWSSSAGTSYAYVVFFSVNPTTGAITSIANAMTKSLGSGNYANDISGNVYPMDNGKVGIYWSKRYYTTSGSAGWHTSHEYQIATFTNSGSVSTVSTFSEITSSSNWEQVASGSQYLAVRGNTSWVYATWNGSTLSSAVTITVDASYSRDGQIYRPDTNLDIFVFAFINTSNQFVIHTYSYASNVVTKTNSYVLIDSGAGVSIGTMTGTGDNIVIGYEDNSKGYVATFTLDGTTKAVSGAGISIQHNPSNQRVYVYGPSATNKYLCVFNNSAGTVNSSVMTVNAYATSSLNWLGVIQANGNAGDSISVVVDGVSGGFTGLTVGLDYYYNTTTYDGTLTTAVNTYKVGRAISTTEVLLNA